MLSRPECGGPVLSPGEQKGSATMNRNLAAELHDNAYLAEALRTVQFWAENKIVNEQPLDDETLTDLRALAVSAKRFREAGEQRVSKQASVQTVRTGTFSSDDEAVFAGYADTELTWNGFKCPMFERPVAEQIMKHIETQGYTTEYLPDKDTFSWHHPDDEDPYPACQGQDVLFEGKVIHVYGIGAFDWTWHEVTTEALEECPVCHGDGYRPVPHDDDTEGTSVCTRCRGTGHVIRTTLA